MEPELTEAIEAASAQLYYQAVGTTSEAPESCWRFIADSNPGLAREYRDEAREIVLAAAPLIERQVREKIAREIEALDRRGVPVWVNGYQHCIEDAAAIARADGDKTEAGT